MNYVHLDRAVQTDNLKLEVSVRGCRSTGAVGNSLETRRYPLRVLFSIGPSSSGISNRPVFFAGIHQLDLKSWNYFLFGGGRGREHATRENTRDCSEARCSMGKLRNLDFSAAEVERIELLPKISSGCKKCCHSNITNINAIIVI